MDCTYTTVLTCIFKDVCFQFVAVSYNYEIEIVTEMSELKNWKSEIILYTFSWKFALLLHVNANTVTVESW